MNFDVRCSVMLIRKNNYTLFKSTITKKLNSEDRDLQAATAVNIELLNYDSKTVRVAQNTSFALAQ